SEMLYGKGNNALRIDSKSARMVLTRNNPPQVEQTNEPDEINADRPRWWGQFCCSWRSAARPAEGVRHEPPIDRPTAGARRTLLPWAARTYRERHRHIRRAQRIRQQRCDPQRAQERPPRRVAGVSYCGR